MYGTVLDLAPSVVRTTSGSGEVLPVESGELALTLDVTAASGTTPTLDVVIEDAPSPAGPWTLLATFPQQTGIATEVERITNAAFHRYVRVRWTIGGTTPSFTFSVQATAR